MISRSSFSHSTKEEKMARKAIEKAEVAVEPKVKKTTKKASATAKKKSTKVTTKEFSTSTTLLIDKSLINENSKVAKKKLNSILDAILSPATELPPDEELTQGVRKTTKRVTSKATKKVAQITKDIEEKNSIKSEEPTAIVDEPTVLKETDKRKPIILEYYDLPYRYNKTIVKVLAQDPNTLFVYWEISDEDQDELRSIYGDDFFKNTKPVLVIRNLTENYVYELEINDFANNWYIHVGDSKCKYEIELGRRPIDGSRYFPITSSNVMEAPNDHVLFFKEGDRIVFKNIYTNTITTRIYRDSKYGANVKALYHDYNLENGRFDYRNPSSQNPTSNVM
jgi:hypothetical protein